MVNIPECTTSYMHSNMAANSVAIFMEEVKLYDCFSLYNKQVFKRYARMNTRRSIAGQHLTISSACLPKMPTRSLKIQEQCTVVYGRCC